MEAKAFGHHIHPMFIVFPLGLLVTALIFDILRLVTGSVRWGEMVYFMIAAGVIGGLIAALFGLIDWLGLSGGTRARRIGAWHGLLNLCVVILFAASWFVRRPDPANPPMLAFLLILVGGGLGLVAGWLGGELVERLGIGVDAGANPNASSSLGSASAAPRRS